MAPKGGTDVEKNKVEKTDDKTKTTKDEKKVDEPIPEEVDLSEEDQALK